MRSGRMKEAYYYFIHFDAEATCPAEVEKRVRIMEPVIRYLCVKEKHKERGIV